MDRKKIADALRAAEAMLIIEELAPAEHEVEKRNRANARTKVHSLIAEAMAELKASDPMKPIITRL